MSESVESLSRNRNLNMTQNLPVCTIYCRPEVANDVILGMAADIVGADVPIRLGVSRSNGFRDN